MEPLLGDNERRVRDDSGESTEEKRVGLDPSESTGCKRFGDDSGKSRKRVRDCFGESDLDLLEVKRLRDDLLGVLDDSDTDPASLDLDSVIKSFEDELSASPPSTTAQGSGETQPDLGYLLEASDDELGLPPPSTAKSEEKEETATELVRVSSDSSGIGESWGIEDQIPSYDLFELGFGDGYGGGYVAVDGLFEYSNVCFDSSDLSAWRQESLPAE